MIQPKALALILLFPLTGCINLPGIDDPPPEQGPTGPSNPDAGTPDAGPREPLEVRWVTPADTVYTNGSVDLKVEVTGGTADTVELYAGEVRLAVLSAPYAYSWDTALITEGTHPLTAKATHGDHVHVSESRTVVVDRTPPHVVSRSPQPAARNVSVHEPIRVTFSEPLDPASLKEAAVALSAGASEVAKTLSLSPDGGMLTIIPQEVPTAPSTLSVELKGALTDRAGNALVVPGDAWSWHLPAWLPVGGSLSAVANGPGNPTYAYYPVLRLDALDRPVVAWMELTLQSSSYSPTLFVHRWSGTGWEALGEAVARSGASPGANELSRWLSLELDSADNPVLAWVQSATGSITVYRWAEGRWASEGSGASNGTAHFAFNPSLQLDADGNAWVSWGQHTVDEYSSGPSHTYVASRKNEAWEVSGPRASGDTRNSSAGVMKLNGSSEPVVAWSEAATLLDAFTIQVMQRSGGQWRPFGGMLSANPGSTDGSFPSLRLDGNGSPILAWQESDGTADNIYVWRWTGGMWESLGTGLSAHGGATHARNPSLALTPTGEPVVAWSESDGTTESIHVRHWKNGSWQTVGGVLRVNGVNERASTPSLQVDSAGVPVVAWEERVQRSSNDWAQDVHVHRLNR